MTRDPLPVRVRAAEESDIPTMIGFVSGVIRDGLPRLTFSFHPQIKDLATYEREPDQAKATPELVRSLLRLQCDDGS